VIFKCAAREPELNNGCGPSPKKGFDTPALTLVVTLYTARFNVQKYLRVLHGINLRLVYCSERERKVIISLYSIKLLVFIIEVECLLCGTN